MEDAGPEGREVSLYVRESDPNIPVRYVLTSTPTRPPPASFNSQLHHLPFLFTNMVEL